MFIETLPKKAQSHLEALGKNKYFQRFYLAGGSGAALYLGHRISVDLDFFTKEKFKETLLINNLMKIGRLSIDQKSAGSLTGKIDTTKISFFEYPYPLLFKTNRFKKVKLAHLLDISSMKLDALSTRGTKRDFIDLYFIIKSGFSLEYLIKTFTKKYKGINYNLVHILKSLVYFEDAEAEPMPKMIKDIVWDEVKRCFTKESKKLLNL